MELNSYFNVKRLYLLIKKDLFIEKKFLAITPITIALLIIVASFIAALNRANPNFHISFFTLLLYTIGVVITSKIFSEMHSLKRNHFWYMTPASDLEKVTSRFVISAVIWPLLLMIIYSLISLLSETINLYSLGYKNNPLVPTNTEVWIRIGNYILIQSLFFYGAALFKRHQLIKMGLSLLLFMALLFIIAMIIFHLTVGENTGYFGFRQFYQWGNNYSQSYNFSIDSESLQRIFEIIKKTTKIFYYFIMAPLFWILTYLKIRHNEASNGI